MRSLRDHLDNVWRPRSVYRRLDDIERTLHHVVKTQEKIMATIADVQAAVAAEKTVEDSAITLLRTA